jgi:nicotinate-nucleotide pyrophosphorylase (carboxylating)
MFEPDSRTIDRIIENALQEDLGTGDLTTECVVSPNLKAYGDFVAKEALVLAGWPVVVRTFQQVSSEVILESPHRDGDEIPKGDAFARIEGPAASLLKGERVAINFLQRLSGIATLTRRFVEAVAATKTAILDTRKTTPGLRILEKYAVRQGGGRNHRFGLFDGVLIKENHITAAGGVKEAVRRIRSRIDHLKKIEIEVTSFEELSLALEAGADVILLDNMNPDQAREAVERVGGRVPLEVSGGIRLDNVRAYALTGVDFVSVGALTHSVRAVDISLELRL